MTPAGAPGLSPPCSGVATLLMSKLGLAKENPSSLLAGFFSMSICVGWYQGVRVEELGLC